MIVATSVKLENYKSIQARGISFAGSNFAEEMCKCFEYNDAVVHIRSEIQLESFFSGISLSRSP